MGNKQIKGWVGESVKQYAEKIVNMDNTEFRYVWDRFAGKVKSLEGREYQGINAFILSLFSTAEFFGTAASAKKNGLTLKSGSNPYKVIYWNVSKIKDKNGEEKTIPFLKYYTVYDIDSMEGNKDKFVREEKTYTHQEAEKIVERFFENNKMPFTKSGSGAYFVPSDPKVNMPVGNFETTEAYFQVLFHEIAHATKACGINRKLDYAAEECVADLSSIVMLAKCGMLTDDILSNSAAYIKNWAKNDPETVYSVLDHVAKVVGFLLTENGE